MKVLNIRKLTSEGARQKNCLDSQFFHPEFEPESQIQVMTDEKSLHEFLVVPSQQVAQKEGKQCQSLSIMRKRN